VPSLRQVALPLVVQGAQKSWLWSVASPGTHTGAVEGHWEAPLGHSTWPPVPPGGGGAGDSSGAGGEGVEGEGGGGDGDPGGGEGDPPPPPAGGGGLGTLPLLLMQKVVKGAPPSLVVPGGQGRQ
jgi:hypothetical protein